MVGVARDVTGFWFFPLELDVSYLWQFGLGCQRGPVLESHQSDADVVMSRASGPTGAAHAEPPVGPWGSVAFFAWDSGPGVLPLQDGVVDYAGMVAPGA